MRLITVAVIIALVGVVAASEVSRHHKHHRHHHHRRHRHLRVRQAPLLDEDSDRSFTSTEVTGPGFGDLVKGGADVITKIRKIAEIRNTRLEAALAIAASRTPDVTEAYFDVVRRLIAFRLADPDVSDQLNPPQGKTHWKDALGEIFQLPGAPNDPAVSPDVCRKAFVDFNTDRSGMSLVEVDPAWFDTTICGTCPQQDGKNALPQGDEQKKAFPNCKKVKKLKNTVPRSRILDLAIKSFHTLFTVADYRAANHRELTHFISRATECGEETYENGRKSNKAAEAEDDAWFEKGCMRWIIRQVHKVIDTPKPEEANDFMKNLNKAGFSFAHVRKQRENLYKKDGAAWKLISGDDNLNKKGWLNPLTDNVCRKARPNGGAFAADASHREKDGKPVFRFSPLAPPACPTTTLTSNVLDAVGLSPLSPHEKEYCILTKDRFNADTRVGWGVGGNIWMINGVYDPKTDSKSNPFAKEFLKAREEQLLTTAAGPSGTTDEFLQMFDYAGLTADANDKYHLLNGILGAFANMGIYYHHSFFEVMLGAGTNLLGQNVVGRAFSYDPTNPFGWINDIPDNPQTKATLTWLGDSSAPNVVVKPYIPASFADNKLRLDNVFAIYARIRTGTALETALSQTDFPDVYVSPAPSVTTETIVATKGPHVWKQVHEPAVSDEDIKKTVCAPGRQALTTIYRYTFCHAYHWIDWAQTGVNVAGTLTPFAQVDQVKLHGQATAAKADKFITGGYDEMLEKLDKEANAKFVVTYKEAVNLDKVKIYWRANGPRKFKVTFQYADKRKWVDVEINPALGEMNAEVTKPGVADLLQGVKKVEFESLGDGQKKASLTGVRLLGFI